MAKQVETEQSGPAGSRSCATATMTDVEAQPTAVGEKNKSSNLHARTTTTTDKPDTDEISTSTPNKNNGSGAATSSGSPSSNALANHHFVRGINTWLDRFTLTFALIAWYTVGVLAIVTTKVLIADWHCPALVLTVQQLFFGSIILRLVVAARDGAAQPWPWEHYGGSSNLQQTEIFSDKLRHYLPFLGHPNFVLAGVFNSLDFLCSNHAFSQSAAHFVETIKASDPITTTAVALVFRVDTLVAAEGASLFLLVTGVLLSTWGNAEEDNKAADGQELADSLKTVAIAMTANICFAFRAMNQKRYRVKTNELQQLDDVNLFGRMCQTGATFLALPLVLLHWPDFQEAWRQPAELQWTYVGLALVNSFSYVTYNLASTYVLSKLTVLHHSSLNCLRRMVAILATSLFFHKPMSYEATAGLLTSFFGFASFTYHRAKRTERTPSKAKDSNV